MVTIAVSAADESIKNSFLPLHPSSPDDAFERGTMTPRLNVLGVGVSAVNMDQALAQLRSWIDQRARMYVCVTGVHGVMESRRSSALQAIHNNAGLVVPDGMPLVWLLKLAGYASADRVCGPELMPRFIRDSVARGDRHFFYGGSEAAIAALQKRVRAMAPGVCIAGAISPPYRPLSEAEDAAMVEAINAAKHDIICTELNTQKDERWIRALRDRLAAPALVGVGAAFDMEAGLVKRAPLFLRRTGFEWTYRLVKEPRRLWKRYLSSNPKFVLLAALQAARLYRPPLVS